MQLNYVHAIQQMFKNETQEEFQQFYRNYKQKAKYRGQQVINQGEQRQEDSFTSETNETIQNQIALPDQKEEQSMQSTFKSLTDSQVLKIYADAQFFKELLSNQEEYPREIDQILWKVTYLLGQIIMEIQSALIQEGYLQNSVILSVKQIKEAAFKMIELQLTNKNYNAKELRQVKQRMLDVFEKSRLQTEQMVKVYNFLIRTWKRPLEIKMNLEPNEPARPATIEKDIQTDPIIVPKTPSIPKTTAKNVQSHKMPTNNKSSARISPQPTPPQPVNSKFPPKFDLDQNRNLIVSQVTAFNPKEPTPGKKAIQNKIKRAKSRIEAADRPLHLYNRKIRQKLNNNSEIYEQYIEDNLQSRGIQEDIDKHFFQKPKQTPNNKKTVRDMKLDAVKDKMAMYNANTTQSPIQRPNTPKHNDINLNQTNTPTPPKHKVMDLCSREETIMLDQNRKRIIARQMNGFRPAIIQDKKYSMQQNIMKGSFGPNFNNNMMVPARSEKRIGKEIGSGGMANKNTNIMTFRQSTPLIGSELRPQTQTTLNVEQNQIIDLNPSKPEKPINTKNNNTSNPANQINLSNVKVQQKIEESTLPPQKPKNDKLNLPEEILARPTSIQPITIPIIAEDSFTLNKKAEKSEKQGIDEQQKQNLRKMRERWSPDQEKILTQNFIQKGDEFACSKLLQQAYGPQNPKHSPAGVRIKIDAIVRKVHQKFCSLNTKNQNIRKFKQNWQFIRKKSTMPVRRRIYKQIVVIYTAMLNMSEQKRQIISSKVTEINRICQHQQSKMASVSSNPNQQITTQAPSHQ